MDKIGEIVNLEKATHIRRANSPLSQDLCSDSWHANSRQHGGSSRNAHGLHMQCRNCHFAQTGIAAGFCCRKCVRTPGAHGPFCEQRLLKCPGANCGFAITRHGATHCCLRCEHGEPHGPRCKRIYAEPAPDSDRFVGPRCLPSEFQLGDRVRITSGMRHVGETGMVVHVGTGGDDEASGEASTGKRGVNSAVLTILSDATQAEVRVAAACVHGCAAVPLSSGGRTTVGRQGRSGGRASSADAAAAGEHADADTLGPEPYQDPELEPELEPELDPELDPELERTLQANALRIEQQEELIGRMLERVELLEAQREAQQPPGAGVG